jgi:hypothetical protein
MHRFRTFLIAFFAIVTTWLAYDNVIADMEPTKALSETAACGKRDCKLQHGMTRVSRTPIGQWFEWTWRDGVVSTVCRRELFVVGAMRCVVE